MRLKSKRAFMPAILTLCVVFFAAACSTGTATEPTEGMMEDIEHVDERMETGVERAPNNGAVIRLISPVDGEVIQGGEVEFVIEVENFELGVDGNHWHIYIDGDSWGMVMGETNTQVLRGIPPGEHRVSVYLSNAEHQDLEDHASADITVEE